MVLVSDARVVWKVLNGIFCVYKPAGVSVYQLRKTILSNLCNDLCQLETRPPEDYVYITGDPLKCLSVRVAPSYADHVLVVGPRYQPTDFRCSWSGYLWKDTSGVLVLGLNDGVPTARKLHMTRPSRAYHVKGVLGQATDTYFKDGQVVEKATFRHVKVGSIEKVLAAMQAAHQKQMFQQCGVDMQSQAAYDLAVQGPIRPSSSNLPVIYSIKCIDFHPPQFTIEVQCINEYEMYLKTLIHDLGMQLHTCATCTAVQCMRYSHLTLQQALLRRHWHLQAILDNMTQCKDILEQRDATRQYSAVLTS